LTPLEDDPDFLLNGLIKNIAGFDDRVGKHLSHCNECKSVLTVALKIAIKNMMKDPKLSEAFLILGKHLDHLGN